MSRLNGKGQVTIPAELRQRLRIEEDSLLEVEEREGGIMLKPLAPLPEEMWLERRVIGRFLESWRV